jgi:hypothetical protein
MYIEGSQVDIQTQRLEPDRLQLDRPAARDVLHRYSYATFISLRFHAHNENFGTRFKNVMNLFSYFLKFRVRNCVIWNCISWGVYTLYETPILRAFHIMRFERLGSGWCCQRFLRLRFVPVICGRKQLVGNTSSVMTCSGKRIAPWSAVASRGVYLKIWSDVKLAQGCDSFLEF